MTHLRSVSPALATSAIKLAMLAVVTGACFISATAWSAGAAGESPALVRAGILPETRWADLIPKGWDLTKQFRGAGNAVIDDGSLQAMDLMRDMRAIWDNAPTNQKLDGTPVRLPGYIVPLEETDGEITEFLLVPYFGACIHTPPPPANQIVHVNAARPLKGLRSMDAVWVSGTLRAQRQDSVMGMSGYQIQSADVVRYGDTRR